MNANNVRNANPFNALAGLVAIFGLVMISLAVFFALVPYWDQSLAALIVVGKNLLTRIIINYELANLYDAAGSILILMLWVYYTMAIFLFGATFTFTRAKRLRNGRKQAT